LSADTALAPGGYYLDSLLAPLAAWLERPDVTDIYVNRAGEVWIETLGGAIESHRCPALSEQVLARLARQIAAASAQGISRAHPLLAASLPDRSRVQIAAPPATRGGHVLAIRRHVAASLSLENYEDAGSFDEASTAEVHLDRERHLVAVPPDEVRTVLRSAVCERRNLLVSGGTSSGKTTFLGALLREIPAEERLILIEDTPELEMTHANAVGLIAARSALGEAEVRAEDLLMAALRMRPDRIILGELRGSEAFTFLRAVNTGHPGSMTTIHADSPERGIEQLALLVLQAGTRLSREDVRHYVRTSIDVFVQLDRQAGRRKVSQVLVRS
jgi:type IV secretion system protein VirB11